MRKNPAFVFHVIGSSLLFVSVLAAAQGRGAMRSALLNALDTNKDGKLSADEIAAAPKNLLKLDINGDGSITLDELQPAPETAIASPDDLVKQLMVFDKSGKGYLVPSDLSARMQSMFTRGDTNHDGKLTPDEIRALAARQTLPTGNQKMSTNDPIFLAIDLNHDGVLSPDEIAAASTSLLALDKNHAGEISAEELRPPPQTPAQQADHILGENDTDKDGKISRAEAPDYLKGQFDAIDTNHDGYIDRDELIAHFTANPGRGGGGPGGSPAGQRERPLTPANPDNSH